MMSLVPLLKTVIAAMAVNIHKSFNSLFSGNLTRADEENISVMIEDYFCLDSGSDIESESEGKCIYMQ